MSATLHKLKGFDKILHIDVQSKNYAQGDCASINKQRIGSVAKEVISHLRSSADPTDDEIVVPFIEKMKLLDQQFADEGQASAFSTIIHTLDLLHSLRTKLDQSRQDILKDPFIAELEELCEADEIEDKVAVALKLRDFQKNVLLPALKAAQSNSEILALGLLVERCSILKDKLASIDNKKILESLQLEITTIWKVKNCQTQRLYVFLLSYEKGNIGALTDEARRTRIVESLDRTITDLIAVIPHPLIGKEEIMVIYDALNLIRDEFEELGKGEQIDLILKKIRGAPGIRELLSGRAKTAIIDELSKLKAPQAVIDRLLQEYSSEELQILGENQKILSSHLKTLKQRCENFARVAKENKALIKHFSAAYSKEIVQRVYASFPEHQQQQFHSGCLSLAENLETFRAKCEESYHREMVDVMLPKEDLTKFFRTARVIGYGEGYNGVYFVEGEHQGKPLRLVVKAAHHAVQEAYATELISSLHIKTPDTCFVSSRDDKPLFDQMMIVLKKNAQFQKNFPSKGPQQFTLMTFIPGVTLEKLRAEDILGSSRENTDLFYDKVLVEIGQIAAADFLLYYQDRLPTIGMGNLANLMILKDAQQRCIGAVAIDQVASLSEGVVQRRSAPMKQASPFERIRNLVGPIIASPDEISQPARDIYEDAIPESVKGILDGDRALASIQKGIIIGLSKVVTRSKEQLVELHRKCPARSHDRDRVDLGAYQKMLAMLQSTALLEE